MNQTYKIYFACYTLFLLLAGGQAFSQFAPRKEILTKPSFNYPETQKKASQYFLHEEYRFALPLYLELYQADSNDYHNNYRTGVCYLNTTEKSAAIKYLVRAQQLEKKQGASDIDYFLGQAYHSNHKFDKAIEYYNKYKASLNPKHEFDVELSKEINRAIAQCNTGKKLIASPVNVVIEHVSAKVNSPYSEKFPLISYDGNTLYFSSGRPMTTGGDTDPNTEQYYDDIYSSTKQKGEWMPAKQLSSDINSSGNDAPLSITSDGKRIYFYSSKGDEGKIYFVDKNDTTWSMPQMISDNISTEEYETGACISPDGKTFYFSSEREGGFGGEDIYKSQLMGDNTWDEPVNLGPQINTPYDEDDPFLLADGKTFYFSSQGHNTMGGFDIFVSKFDPAKKTWTVPANMGYPINSAEDEISISWSADGKMGYFSEDNESGFGNEDIYTINLAAAPKTNTSVELPATALKETPEPVQKESTAAVAKNETTKSEGNTTAKKEIPEAVKKETVEKTIVESATASNSNAVPSISAAAARTVAIDKAYPSEPKVGEVLKEQVHFAFNESHSITEYSKNKIASVIALLNKYPAITIEIEGFTDPSDNLEYNLEVSKKRAQAVYDYMLKKGIDKKRLQLKVYADSQHDVNASSSEADIRHRRVEFKIIKAK